MKPKLRPYRATLDGYRATLPPNEYAALEQWLSSFWPFQLPWLLEPARNAICCKARQIGMSHTTSALGVLWGAFHGELTTIISIGQPESNEVLDKAKKHAAVLEGLGSKLAGLDRSKETGVTFSGGGRILALPSSGGRGYTGNIFCDEFAYQIHAEDVWDSVGSVTLLGDSRIRISSTPNGIGNTYHQLWKRALVSDRWATHEIPLEAATSIGYPIDDAECWERAKGDPRLYNQLYRCKFLDGSLQYVPGELIELASTDDITANDGPYFAGLDIGKTVDLTVLCVVRKWQGSYYVVYLETCRRTDSDLLEQMVERAFKKFSLRKLAVDATGIGAFPAERMAKRHGVSKVEPVTFTLQSKEELATHMYTLFAERRLRIPKTKLPASPNESPDKLREDIASIARIITPAGNVKYDAPHTSEGHADRAWALALALHVGANAPTYAMMQ
jgi:phage FluMu gp28-like protein